MVKTPEVKKAMSQKKASDEHWLSYIGRRERMLTWQIV